MKRKKKRRKMRNFYQNTKKLFNNGEEKWKK
jgi:hypothetical protein